MKRIITIYLIFMISMSVVGCGNKYLGEAVFDTENVKSVTFFSPAAREGALVSEEELPEIIEWLGTFTVGEKAGKQLAPGTNSISVCIEYADGTIWEQGLSTTKIGNQTYDMNFADAPECYLKLVNPEPASDKWDCTVTCAEVSDEDSYVITYSNEEITADTGIITIQNRNSFDIVVHLLTEGEEERVAEVKSGGVTVLHQINKERIYTVGFHADVAEGTKINIMVYDGEWSEPYMGQMDSARNEIYMEAVEKLINEKVFPNGDEALPDEVLQENNSYAVMDIDGDGREELLINYPHASCMAGMSYYIFDYDSERKEFHTELLEFPALRIYDNGVVLADASHNHGRSSLDDFWPYSVHRYNPEKDVYDLITLVDAWQEILYEGAEPDKEFPKEKDTDGDGIVYYLRNLETGEPEKIMDNDEYKGWQENLTTDTIKIEPVYKSFKEFASGN